MAIGLAAGLCLASGYLIVTMGWGRRNLQPCDLLLRLSLSVGFGLAAFSIVFVLNQALGPFNLLATDLLVFAGLAVSLLLIRSRTTTPFPSEKAAVGHTWLDRVVTVSFLAALCAALYCGVLRAIVHPHGEGWDAFSIWNLHARFLFRGSEWRDGFSPLIPWSHPDYPLILPAAIAHFWSYLGHENQAVPAVIGLCFTFGTVGILWSSLARLRGRTSAMLGGLTVLATPFFIEQGTSQYADVPLSFFVLATISLLCLYDHSCGRIPSSDPRGLLVLAGLAATFAAWTKNEGLLFLGSLGAARMLILVREWNRENASGPSSMSQTECRERKWSAIAPLFLGLIPVLLLIGWFKHSIAPPGDLFPDRATALHKVHDPSRYWVIFRWYWKEFFRFGDWLFTPGTILLAAFYLLADKEDNPLTGAGFRISTVTLALTLAGYFAIYLITPHDINWHLRNSLARLFLQLWPSVIFLFFLVAPPIVKKPAQ
jgi:Dolichyl-phosphate-mannose-protein mannosyltransferase